MTSTGPRTPVIYQNFYPRKDRANSTENGQNHHPSSINTNRGRPNPVPKPRSAPDIDEQLWINENVARGKFIQIKKGLGLKKLPEWLYQMLDKTVLPILQGIGYDRFVARTLFELTPFDWKFMEPVNEKVIVLYPEINHEIKEVLQGIARMDICSRGNLPHPAGRSSAMITGSIGHNPSPENLFELLDEIDTSWITLPRTLAFLERKHGRYLLQYLQTIEGQTSESCLKVFSRITTEFLGNFVLKFADGHHLPDQIEKLLFYGYSTMYWKNLRQPPPGMENSAVFEHFLNWVSRLAHRSRFLGSDDVRSVYRMMEIKSAVFPVTNINQPQDHGWNDNSRLAITLRHGPMGAAAILKYFGIDQFLEIRQTRGQSPFHSSQNHLHSLLLKIQMNYHQESKRTRRFIRQFIGHLKSAYENSQPASQRLERRFLYRMISNLHLLFNN